MSWLSKNWRRRDLWTKLLGHLASDDEINRYILGTRHARLYQFSRRDHFQEMDAYPKASRCVERSAHSSPSCTARAADYPDEGGDRLHLRAAVCRRILLMPQRHLRELAPRRRRNTSKPSAMQTSRWPYVFQPTPQSDQTSPPMYSLQYCRRGVLELCN